MFLFESFHTYCDKLYWIINVFQRKVLNSWVFRKAIDNGDAKEAKNSLSYHCICHLYNSSTAIAEEIFAIPCCIPRIPGW